MRLLLPIAGCGALALTLTYHWIQGEPRTELVDAAGRELTAGPAPSPVVADSEGEDPFSEVRRCIEAEGFARARSLLTELLETTERDGEACVLLSDVMRELDDIAAAVDYGLKAMELLPEHAPAHLAYANALGVQLLRSLESPGDLLRAMPRVVRFKRALTRVVELDPMDTEARTMMVFSSMAPIIGDGERAIEIAREIEAIDTVLGKKMLAYAFESNDETERAIQVCLEALDEHPETLGFFLILGGLYGGAERFEEADEAYVNARKGELDEGYYHALYGQAIMRLEHGFGEEEALMLFDEFLSARPKGEMLPTLAKVHWKRGAVLEVLERSEEARGAYRRSLRLEPEFGPAKDSLDALE